MDTSELNKKSLSNVLKITKSDKKPQKGQYTFTMIKPFAVKSGFIGHILSKINEKGFRIVSMKYIQLSLEQAKSFYEVHKDKSFYDKLSQFMSSGPIVVAILEKDNAVETFRTLIGSTDPAKAKPGTIRNLFGKNIQYNAVHGSDSDDNAEKEANFFFSRLEWF